MLKVRRTLTEVLLSVTGSEMTAIAQDMLKKAMSKGIQSEHYFPQIEITFLYYIESKFKSMFFLQCQVNKSSLVSDGFII